MSTISISLKEIYDLAKKTLLFNGCDEENASILSDTIEFFKKMQSMDGVRLPGERRHKNRLDLGKRKINKELIEKIKKLS